MERVLQEEVEEKTGARSFKVWWSDWILFKMQGGVIRGFKQENEHDPVYDLKRSPVCIKEGEGSDKETSWRAVAGGLY